MAWNRQREPMAEIKGARKFKPTYIYLTCFALIVVIGIFVIPLFKSDSPQLERQTRLRIVTKEASYRPKTAKGDVFVAKRKVSMTKDVAKPEVSHAEVFLKPKIHGRLVVWQTKNPPVFTNSFEGYIAGILTTQPGERILSVELPENFDDDLAESLNTKVVVDKDDSEEVAELKEAVNATKEEVRLRIQKGERARDIIQDSLLELNKIADYRDQVQAAFNQYVLEAKTPKDLVEYEKEANAILAEYGALPIEGPHDEETAYEVMVEAKEDKISELSKEIEKQ